MDPIIRKEDGTILIIMEDESRPPQKFLVVVPPEVEAAETRHIDDTCVASTLASPLASWMQLRHCGGVERFTTKNGQAAIKVLPGTTHLLMYGRIQNPYDMQAWVRTGRALAELLDADLHVHNRRGNSEVCLRVAEKELVRVCAEELSRSKGR